MMKITELASRTQGATTGAAFLMATSAIGPGFLTQTAVFTSVLGADFAFAILASVLVDLAVQVNVWRVLGVARRRGQELASAVLPGLGTVLALLVAGGGLAFNVGNLAGCGLGLDVLGVPAPVGATLSAAVAILLLVAPEAGRAMDRFAKVLGAVMILLTAGVVAVARPDYAAAVRAAVWPGQVAFLPIVTIVGGTVGGYITFSGAHRLLDAGIGGPEDVSRLGRAAAVGIVVTGLMRVLLFLAVLGVVARAGVLDPSNPPASAFRLGAGEVGYLVVGRPVRLLILAGALNGLILPGTLGVVLVAGRRRDLMGAYRHPAALQAAGWLAWLVSAAAGALAMG